MQKIYQDRRNRLMTSLGAGVLVLPGARLTIRNSDVHHSFRQDSDFFYLTGFDEPASCLILSHDGNGKTESILLVPPKNKEKEIWDGYREGVEGVVKNYGVDLGYSNEELSEVLFQKLEGHKTLFFDFDRDSKTDKIIHEVLLRFKTLKRKNPVFPRKIQFFKDELGEMRHCKSSQEVEMFKQCAEVTRQANEAVMKALKPGMYEYEIEAILEYEYKRRGGTHGYGHIVAGGYNATCLHYHDNNQKLEAGTILLIDSGCELPHKFTADVTRCYPVDGKFPKKIREIYEIVLEANKRAIAKCVVGSSIREVHREAQRVLAMGLVKLGVLSGEADTLIENGELGKFYMHGTSHWLGMDVHDVGRYDEPDGTAVLFREGMMLTIEPGLYFRKEYSGIDTPYEGIGIRIEDDVLIGANGPVVLTSSIPKEVGEIEAIMSGKQ